MKSIPEKIQDIKSHGYVLDFSNVFELAFENYKKIAVYAGLILLVFSIFFGAIIYLILASTLGIEQLTNENLLKFNPLNLSPVHLVYYILANVFISALFSPFGAGFLKMADCAQKDQEFKVATIFTYYKTHHFLQLFTATFFISVISIVGGLLLQYLKLDLLSMVLSLSISFFTFLTVPLIVFGNLKAFTAIKSSLIIISKQPLVFLALMMTIIGGILIGLMAICIGLLFTIPFTYSMTYAIYCTIFNIDKEDPIDSIGQSDF